MEKLNKYIFKKQERIVNNKLMFAFITKRDIGKKADKR